MKDPHIKTVAETARMIKEGLSNKEIVEHLIDSGMYKTIGGFRPDFDVNLWVEGFVNAFRRVMK